MKCSIKDCLGEYEKKNIVHTLCHEDDVMVIDHVPAEVCSVCGDTLLNPETIRHIENIVENESPDRTVPLYEYANRS